MQLPIFRVSSEIDNIAEIWIKRYNKIEICNDSDRSKHLPLRP